jgi:guanyl-specific ribonuclease Sa
MRHLFLALLLLLAPLDAFARGKGKTAAPSTTVAEGHWYAAVSGAQVDVSATMQRIAAGGKNPHRNDGTTFQNREKRLPKGHTYTEYVVPTPGQRGPGPRRIVVDEAGKAYYTPDHYANFYPVEKAKE